MANSDVVIHPVIGNDGRFASQGEVIREFDDDHELRDYFLNTLNRPFWHVRETRTNTLLAQPISVASPWCTTFYNGKNYTGLSLTLCNITSSIEAEFKLSDNNLNDKISSIKVGDCIACVLCCQHTIFRGKRLWLLGGKDRPDLSKVAFPGGGNWDNRISSCLSATVSPTQVLVWLLKLIF